MTTSLSDPASRGLCLALALALGSPLAAQEVALPSGHSAILYDVVLEASAGIMTLDAEVDLDEVEVGAIPEDLPLDIAQEGLSAGASGGLARFRLRVPGLGGDGAAYEDLATDFAWLCESVALPALAANGWAAAEIVIAFSDREVPFGYIDEEAVQFFEGFRVLDGTCIGQAF